MQRQKRKEINVGKNKWQSELESETERTRRRFDEGMGQVSSSSSDFGRSEQPHRCQSSILRREQVDSSLWE